MRTFEMNSMHHCWWNVNKACWTSSKTCFKKNCLDKLHRIRRKENVQLKLIDIGQKNSHPSKTCQNDIWKVSAFLDPWADQKFAHLSYSMIQPPYRRHVLTNFGGKLVQIKGVLHSTNRLNKGCFVSRWLFKIRLYIFDLCWIILI